MRADRKETHESIQPSEPPSSPPSEPVLTLEALSEAKGIPVEFLASLGITDDMDGVYIPYRDASGSVVAVKERRKLGHGKHWAHWPAGVPLMPYGREREKSDKLVIVEGESDCWTLWMHGIPALGLPGTQSASRLSAEDVAGRTTVYVMREPDKAGSEFPASVQARLLDLGFAGEVRAISTAPAKDPNDLMRANPSAFRAVFLAIIESAQPVTDEPPSDRDILETDMGNARRLAIMHGANLRYTSGHGWLVQDGKRWAEDDIGAVHRLARESMVSIFDEAKSVSIEHPARAKTLANWAVKSQSIARIEAMVSLGRSEPEIAARACDFDQDPWAVNFSNGTLNLQTGHLRDHNPSDLITKLCPADWDDDATCPRWDAFLARVQPDAEMRLFLQRAVGYSLSGITQEQCFFVHHGAGSNGKGVFFETLKSAFGSYASTVAFESFIVQRYRSGPRNDLAGLVGARLVTACEGQEGAKLDMAVLKQLSGGDTITARMLYREYFSYVPSFKINLITNHRPVITDTSHGAWRRVRLIPWEVTISDTEADLSLGLKLLGELPGIIRWAVDGCYNWQREGLRPPQSVLVATKEYRESEDVISRFIADRCFLDSSISTKAPILFAAYLEWAAACNERPENAMNNSWFSRRMSERGFTHRRTTMGASIYDGIAIRESPA